MKRSSGISDFLEEIPSLSHSVVFLYFFALIAKSDTTEQLNNNKNARNAENVREEPGSSQTRGGPGSGPWEGGSCQRTSVRMSLCLQGGLWQLLLPHH